MAGNISENDVEKDWETLIAEGREPYEWVVVDRMVDESLSPTSAILVKRQKMQAAQAMLRVARLEKEYSDGFNGDFLTLWLEYEPEDVGAFTDDVRREISDVWIGVVRRRNYGDQLDRIDFRESLPIVGYGWREQLAELLNGERRTNHAVRVRQEDPRWTEDGLYFTNSGELQLYRRLKWWQENRFGQATTFALFPLARGRVRGKTLEPDILITFRRTAGIIEVDGPHHQRSRASDTSRDELLRDAGVAEVYRIPVGALNDLDEVDQHINRFLNRLLGK